MKYKKVIGLTGSIATGKSTAAGIIRGLGYPVIDADLVGHDLMQVDQINYIAVLDYFGRGILNDDQTIDRKKLGEIVFSDKDMLESLNRLTHDNIFNRIVDIIGELDDEIVFIEMPLLIELIDQGKMPMNFDEIWLVYLDRQTQLKRLIERNAFSLEEAESRVNSQLSVDYKKSYADYIIYNDGDLNHLEKQIIERLGKIHEDNC